MMGAMSANTVLEIENLNVSYYTRAGEVPAVTDFSLSLREGETVGLVGESGCGKSTVASAIMQYLGKNGGIKSGSIRFKGRELNALNQRQLRQMRGSQIAMIYQEPFAALNPALTIAAQLMEVPMLHEGVSRAEAQRRVLRMLEDVQLPDPERVMQAYPHQLSGGQQQRAVIAMALLSRPSLLLLDEPTTALDVTVEAGIVKLIADLSEKFGTSQLYISHNLGLILQTCERVYVMYSGEVVEQGTVDALYSRPRHPYTRGLFDCIPLPHTDKSTRPLKPIRGQLPLANERPQGCNFGPRCDHFISDYCDRQAVSMESVAASGDGQHRVRCLRWREMGETKAPGHNVSTPPRAMGEDVLEVKELRKYYQVHERSLAALIAGRGRYYVKANESLSFTARRGETLALVGESGCGKSTFARVLMGLERCSGGEIRYEGVSIADKPVAKRSPTQLRALQMVFQNPSATLNPSRTVGAQIGRAIKKLGEDLDSAGTGERLRRLLDLVKLPHELSGHKPRRLSGGEQQRVAIARAFAGNPAIVVADEPVSALDVSVSAAITELLMDMQRRYGTTLLFISHDLGLVRYLADTVVVMYLGRIMERGTTEQIFSPPYHPYTEALLAAVPIADPKVAKREIVLQGNLPSAVSSPTGCPFHTRCPRKLGSVCEQQVPPMQRAGAHVIACHIPLIELRAIEPVIKLVS
jgi:peptide/nickel transport system ATP-binding protein